MIEWQTIIETAIGSASGAAIILLISYFIGKRRRDFNDAILMQLDLHQMLGVSLKVKNDYKTGQIYNESIKIISSIWMLTQFLTYHRGKTRSIVKCLFDAKLSYQKLQKNVGLR